MRRRRRACRRPCHDCCATGRAPARACRGDQDRHSCSPLPRRTPPAELLPPLVRPAPMTRPTHRPAIRLVVQSAAQTHIDDMVDLARPTPTARTLDLAAVAVPLQHPQTDLTPIPVVPPTAVLTGAHPRFLHPRLPPPNPLEEKNPERLRLRGGIGSGRLTNTIAL
jgi:hypothetical protein